MTGLRKVLFYSDAREFGGHEHMTVAAAQFMAEQPGLQISFAYCDKNHRLHGSLSGIRGGRKLTLYALRIKSEGPRGVRSLFYMSRLPLVQRLIESVMPDVVVVSQGTIEVSSLGLIAAKRAHRRTISYIPMGQRFPSSSRLISVRRDIIDRYLYGLPDKVITISEAVRQTLKKSGVRCEISVVCNGIDLDNSKSSASRSANRQIFGFLDGQYIVAIVGRIVFRQKAQDFLVRTIAEYRDQLRGTRFCIIGEGPDEPELSSMIRNAKLDECVSILTWKSDLASLYSAVDMLLIPSRFEGVPLVMLEAMWHQLPIVASDVDGMSELLPREWLFRCGDPESLVKSILRVRHADNSHVLAVNRKRVLDEFSSTSFQENFCREVIGRNEPVSHCAPSDRSESTEAAMYRN